MSGTKPNIGLFVECEVFGVEANAALCHTNSGVIVAGELNPQNKSLGNFVEGVVPIKDLYGGESSAILKESDAFTANFAIVSGDKIAILARSGGLALYIIKNKSDWQAAFALSTQKLKNSSGFEQKIAEVADWAGIEILNIIIQSSWQNKDTQLSKLVNADNLFLDVPNSFQKHLFIAGAKFQLNKNGFGKALNTLTNLNELDLWVGANPKDKSFGVSLVAPRIETELCIIENLIFALNKSASDFLCVASATFTLKLDGKDIIFTLGGSASNTSFMLTGTSIGNTKIYITKKLFLSDLSLAIGISKGVAFGMTGRLTTDKLSIFAGFMISVPPPKVNFLAVAMTSVSGRLSLADIVSDIAEIEFNSVKFLDFIAVYDFDLQTAKNVNVNSNNFVSEFNSAVDNNNLLTISDYKITNLGTNQYIITDNQKLRHFRIDGNGKISLNCQVYICSVKTQIGTYRLNPGIFACGVLEVFGVKARFLFQIEKGVSLIALVQISPIKIGGIFELTGSKKEFPIAPIEGGLAGELVPKPDKNNNPLTLYINIQQKNYTCDLFFSAYLNILNILKADALVVMRDKMIYIDTTLSMWGFSLTIKVAADYGGFSSAKFAFKIIFDTSGFLEMAKKAQEALRNTARQITASITSAQSKITDAQNSVLRLQNEIKNCDNNIAACQQAIRNSKWYQVWIKVGKAAEIVWWNAKKAGIYVAIGVAYTALEVAKAAIGMAGAIATGILNAAATIINYATQLLWIKSFELGVSANGTNTAIATELVLIVLGKEKTIKGSLGRLEDPKNSVQGSINNESKTIEDEMRNGKPISRDVEIEFILDDEILQTCQDLDKNYLEYEKSIEFTNALDNFFVSAGRAHIDAYGAENPNYREIAANLTNMRIEYEMNAIQNEELFNDEFLEAVSVIDAELNSNETRNFSSELIEKSNCLKKYLSKGIHRNEVKRANTSRNEPAPRKNLMEIYDNEIENTLTLHKSRADNSKLSIEKANEKYADLLVASLEKHFGNLDKNSPMNLTNSTELATAIYELRNMRSRSKEKSGESDDDEELL